MSQSPPASDAAPAAPFGTGRATMLAWQLALGIGVLLLWQGASGRLIDNFFISNPVDPNG